MDEESKPGENQPDQAQKEPIDGQGVEEEQQGKDQSATPAGGGFPDPDQTEEKHGGGPKSKGGKSSKTDGIASGTGESGKGKHKEKYVKAYPFRAKDVDEKEIMRALKKEPRKHSYFGLIFSADTDRPPSYYHNYFLPLVKQPGPRQHIQLVGQNIPSDVIHRATEAPRNLMPLSTIKVQWHSHRNSTAYRPESLYAYFLRFGKVENLYPLSVNSALVVFGTLQAAHDAVRCSRLGGPWDPLIADWYEPRLKNVAFYQKYHQLEADDMAFVNAQNNA